MNYFDILLAKKLNGGGGGDITVESLSVTDNGTYTAPSGKAYTPVTVEVQPPANSYQLKSITTPTSLATFEASAMPMPKLKVSVEAKQASGTPSPSNPLPISGWDEVNVLRTGVNIWDEEWEIGNIDNNTGLPVSSSNIIRAKNYINVVPNTTYFCKYLADEGSITVFYYDINKNFISLVYARNMEITTPNNCKYIRFKIASSYGTTYNHDISINYPSTDHDYHAYNGVTTTISLPQTVYGGELDVVNGTSGNRLTHQIETISGGITRTDSSGYLFVVKDLDVPDITDYETVTPYIISNYLTPYSVNDLRANAVFGFTQYNKRLYIRLGADITTVADANAYLASNNLQVKYELATPTTLTTQPTPIKSLNGTNNLSVDCGEILEGEYFIALGGA